MINSWFRKRLVRGQVEEEIESSQSSQKSVPEVIQEVEIEHECPQVVQSSQDSGISEEFDDIYKDFVEEEQVDIIDVSDEELEAVISEHDSAEELIKEIDEMPESEIDALISEHGSEEESVGEVPEDELEAILSDNEDNKMSVDNGDRESENWEQEADKIWEDVMDEENKVQRKTNEANRVPLSDISSLANIEEHFEDSQSSKKSSDHQICKSRLAKNNRQFV